MRTLLSFFNRRPDRDPVFKVRWHPYPDKRGWWLRWEPGKGESLIYVDPEDEAFVYLQTLSRRHAPEFLGPFQLPVRV